MLRSCLWVPKLNLWASRSWVSCSVGLSCVWQWLVKVRGLSGCEVRVEGIIGWVRVWSRDVGGKQMRQEECV